MIRLLSHFGLAALLSLAPVTLASAAITVDGVFSAGEWAGATVKTVGFDPAAPLGNFGAPGNTNHITAYDIYTLGDANNFYVGLVASSSTGGLDFANLYFDTNNTSSAGSDIGFEITNERAFIPGVPGYYPIAGSGIAYSVNSGVIEVQIPWSVFTNNTLGIPGLPLATDSVQLRLSQTFGYSVAGGATYGDDRLGTLAVPAAVPEPSTLAMFGLGLIGFAGRAARRFRNK